MIVGTGQWGNLMTLNDSGRPIYAAVTNPQNANGSVRPDSLRGTVMGLDLYVDPSLNSGDADGTLLLVNPDAYTWYEGPTFRLRAGRNRFWSDYCRLLRLRRTSDKDRSGRIQEATRRNRLIIID